MKVTSLAASLFRHCRRCAATCGLLWPGAAILAGGLAFVGNVHATPTVILAEDFEDDGDDTWGGGGDTFGTYNSLPNWSNSPHIGIPGSGERYGHLIARPTAGSGSSVEGGPLISAPSNLTAGHTQIRFDGWLAAWTGDDDYARFEANFFGDTDGNGASVGTIVLANGIATSAANGVIEYVDAAGVLQSGDAGADAFNWKHYVTSNPIPAAAKSVTISYIGDATGNIFLNQNDAYADNILISTVPEPMSVVILGLGIGCWVGFARCKNLDRD